MAEVFRSTKDLAPGADGFEVALRWEMAADSAAALGRAGRKIEHALQALADADPEEAASFWEDARVALWEMTVHREALGLYNHDELHARWPLPPCPSDAS